MNAVQADRVLKKHYETVFGIYDHRVIPGKVVRPLSGQAALPGNTYDDDRYLSDIIEEYSDAWIYELTKKSLDEYMSLSRENRKRVTRICKDIKDRRLRDKEAAEAAAANAISNTLNGGKGSLGARPQDHR